MKIYLFLQLICLLSCGFSQIIQDLLCSSELFQLSPKSNPSNFLLISHDHKPVLRELDALTDNDTIIGSDIWTICTLAEPHSNYPNQPYITYVLVTALKNVQTLEYLTSYTGSSLDGTIEGLTLNVKPYTNLIKFLPIRNDLVLIQTACTQGACRLGEKDNKITFESNDTNNTNTQWIKIKVDTIDLGCEDKGIRISSVIDGRKLVVNTYKSPVLRTSDNTSDILENSDVWIVCKTSNRRVKTYYLKNSANEEFLTGYNTGNQFVGLITSLTLASKEFFGMTNPIRLTKLTETAISFEIICRILGFQHGWCNLGNENGSLKFYFNETINDNTKWNVEYVEIKNKTNCTNIKEINEKCDINNPFRLITRMTGKLLSITQDFKEFTLNYIDEPHKSYFNSDVWMQCIFDGKKYLRNIETDLYYGTEIINDSFIAKPAKFEDKIEVQLDEGVLVPGYTIFKQNCSNFTTKPCSLNYDYENLNLGDINSNNLWSHWNKQPLNDIYEFKNKCNNQSEKNNKTIICDDIPFRLIARMTGKFLFVSSINYAIELRFYDNITEIYEDSDIWNICQENNNIFVKNVKTGKYMFVINNELYVSDNATTIIIENDERFLGYSYINAGSCDDCWVKYPNDQLNLTEFNEKDLYFQWIKQLI